jgi:hypothetical protein
MAEIKGRKPSLPEAGLEIQAHRLEKLVLEGLRNPTSAFFPAPTQLCCLPRCCVHSDKEGQGGEASRLLWKWVWSADGEL